ncbi:hypothetical protein LguiB_036052 [Lonicera macranthoides]
MQGHLSTWLVKHGLIHRSLGFDYQGTETLQIKPEDWHSIAVILYVYGYNYLRSQCAYDVAPGGLLASVYHLTRIEYGVDQPEEVCIKVFAPRRNPRIPSVFWVWKSVDFQERESYDMLGISYDNHPRLKRILMPENWIGWPLQRQLLKYVRIAGKAKGSTGQVLLQLLEMRLDNILFRLGSVLQVNPTPLVPIGGIGEEALHLRINNTKTLKLSSTVLREGIDPPIPTEENRPFDREILKLRRLGSIKPLSIGNGL